LRYESHERLPYVRTFSKNNSAPSLSGPKVRLRNGNAVFITCLTEQVSNRFVNVTETGTPAQMLEYVFEYQV